MASTTDLTRGSVWTQLVALAVPLLVLAFQLAVAGDLG